VNDTHALYLHNGSVISLTTFDRGEDNVIASIYLFIYHYIQDNWKSCRPICVNWSAY